MRALCVHVVVLFVKDFKIVIRDFKVVFIYNNQIYIYKYILRKNKKLFSSYTNTQSRFFFIAYGPWTFIDRNASTMLFAFYPYTSTRAIGFDWGQREDTDRISQVRRIISFDRGPMSKKTDCSHVESTVNFLSFEACNRFAGAS